MILLYASLFLLIGCGMAFCFQWALLLPLFLLIILSKRPWQGLIYFSIGIIFTKLTYPCLEIDRLEGFGLFHLEKIERKASSFQKTHLLKGTFKTFHANDKTYHNIPCHLFVCHPPETGNAWILEGIIEKKAPFSYTFKPHKYTLWKEMPHFSLARLRFKMKKALDRSFRKKGIDHRTRAFFASMITGNIDDHLLSMEFRKLGLGHILAISGFHFALVAGLISFSTHLFLSPKWANLLLIFLLTVYFFYLGSSPSILRAYIMISLFLFGLLVKRRSHPLNLLGAALIIELFLNPFTITEVSFQLSFLATFAILAFYKPMHTLLEKHLPKRTSLELKQLTFLDLHGYLLIKFLKKNLALNLAVQLATLPLVLYTFKNFPLLSLPYNLLISPLLALSLTLLPFSFLPPIATLNAHFTAWVLRLIAYPPECLNFKLIISTFPFPLLILVLSIVLYLGLTKREKTAYNIGVHGDRSSVG